MVAIPSSDVFTNEATFKHLLHVHYLFEVLKLPKHARIVVQIIQNLRQEIQRILN